jgi:Arylsulfatase regulator (Fe-S oxidoreductase)
MINSVPIKNAQEFIFKLKNGSFELTPEEEMIASAIKRIETLKAHNYGFCIRKIRDKIDISIEDKDLLDNVIIKPVGSNCNLRCTYCYELNNQNQKNNFKTTQSSINPIVMQEDILEAVIYKMLCLCPSRIHFSWHGGEPLLAGIGFYEKVVNFIEKYKKPGQKIKNSIQTNGTLVDDSWIDFFQRNNFTVGFSMDGPLEVHNKHRRYLNGRGTHKDILCNIQKLKKSNLEWGVLGVITSNLDSELIFNYFIENEIFEFDPINRCDVGEFLSNDEYSDCIIKIFNLWIKSKNPKIRMELLDNIIWGLLGYTPRLCSMNGGCDKFVTIGINGDIALGCSILFHNFEKHINIKDTNCQTTLLNELSMFHDSLRVQEENNCFSCIYVGICHGGCSYNKTFQTGKIESRDYYCNAYQKIYNHIYEAINNIIKNRI